MEQYGPTPADYCDEYGHTGGESECPTHCAECGVYLRDYLDHSDQHYTPDPKGR